MFCKIGVPKNFCKIHKKKFVPDSLFFNDVAGLEISVLEILTFFFDIIIYFAKRKYLKIFEKSFLLY